MVALDLIIKPVSGTTAGRYTSAGAITVLLYDIAITLGEESRLIWPSKWSLVKVLYLLNRYFTVPCLLIGAYHLSALRPDPSRATFGLITAVALLVLRVQALYNRDRIITTILYLVYLATFTFIIVEEALYMRELWPSVIYSPLLRTCVANPSRKLALMFFAPVFCDVLLVILQLAHAIRSSMRGVTLHHTAPLLRALYTDGFIYFLAVFSLRLWSACLFSWGDSAYWYTSTYLESALTAISASRLTLHLRKVAKRGNVPPTSGVTGAGVTAGVTLQKDRQPISQTFSWENPEDITGTELTSYEPRSSRSDGLQVEP